MSVKADKKQRFVYTVTAGDYSDYSIVAMFSTEAKAKAFLAVIGDGNVEPWALDAMSEDVRAGREPFFVRLNRETGDVQECERTKSRYSLDDRECRADARNGVYTTCWAKNSAHAIKIASERRAQFLALSPVPR